jgi:hypothetical protein
LRLSRAIAPRSNSAPDWTNPFIWPPRQAGG